MKEPLFRWTCDDCGATETGGKPSIMRNDSVCVKCYENDFRRLREAREALQAAYPECLVSADFDGTGQFDKSRKGKSPRLYLFYRGPKPDMTGYISCLGIPVHPREVK